MTAPSKFAEIVEQVRQYPNQWLSDAQALVLIALVREARGLLDELEISRSQCGVYNGTTWADRRSAFMTRTEEP